MSDLVIARLGQTPADPIGWAAFTGAGLDEIGRAADAEALFEIFARFDDGVRFAAMLPGEQAAMRAFPSPPRNAMKFAAAARLLLEDELAQAVEDCHVATLRTEESGRVFAVDLAVMRRWTSLFADAGFALNTLTIDFECLGGARGRPVLFLEDDRIVASFGDHGFAAERSVALALIESLGGEYPDADVSVYDDAPEAAALDGDPFTRIGPADDEALLCAAAKAIVSGAASNLLQGAFRPQRRRIVDLTRWRRPAIAAAVLLAAFFAYVAVDGVRTQRLANHYAAEAVRLHRTAFPDAADADPRSHARAVLSRSGGVSFLAMSDALGKAAEDVEGVSVDRVRFDAGRGQLVFTISSDSDTKIESFRQALQNYGVAASETGGYRRTGAFWSGEMSVRL